MRLFSGLRRLITGSADQSSQPQPVSTLLPETEDSLLLQKMSPLQRKTIALLTAEMAALEPGDQKTADRIVSQLRETAHVSDPYLKKWAAEKDVKFLPMTEDELSGRMFGPIAGNDQLRKVRAGLGRDPVQDALEEYRQDKEFYGAGAAISGNLARSLDRIYRERDQHNADTRRGERRDIERE